MMGQILELDMIMDLFGQSVPTSFIIADGKLTSPNAQGELESTEMTFAESKLTAEDANGSYFIELLEDGAIAITATTPDGMAMTFYCERVVEEKAE